MKEQNTTLELGKCYRVKFENISWCISVYDELPLTNNSSLTALRVDNTGIDTLSFLMSNSYQDSKYEVQEISSSEFLHELRAKRNEINKMIKKMSQCI